MINEHDYVCICVCVCVIHNNNSFDIVLAIHLACCYCCGFLLPSSCLSSYDLMMIIIIIIISWCRYRLMCENLCLMQIYIYIRHWAINTHECQMIIIFIESKKSSKSGIPFDRITNNNGIAPK